MKLEWTKIRLGSVWLFVPVYLLLAQPSVPLLLAGLALAAVGGFIRAWAAGAIRKNKTLSTHGPYAFTRNPLYLGTFFIGLGFAVAAGHVLFVVGFLLFFAVIYGRTMRKEERRLEGLFGEDYRTYAEHVPRFVPRLPSWSEVIGEAGPGRVAVDPEMRPADLRGAFHFGRYLANREYQAILGIGVMFLALALKLAL